MRADHRTFFACTRAWSAFVLGVAVSWACPASAAERRVALVIGNQAYRQAPLANPVNDARTVAGALRQVGFDVSLATDLDASGLERQVQSFAEGLREGDVAVFFYSGHGAQVGGTNYLIPVDLASADAIDLKYRSVSAQGVQEKIEAAGTRVAILILDACRDNPFRGSRSGDRGLASMTAQRAGTLIAFSTGPGMVAADNAEQSNSWFSQALAAAIPDPGLELKRLFDQVGKRVSAASKGRQLPWLNSNLYDEFYFAGRMVVPEPPSESTAADAPTSPSASPLVAQGGIGSAAPVERVSLQQGDIIKLVLREGGAVLSARLEVMVSTDSGFRAATPGNPPAARIEGTISGNVLRFRLFDDDAGGFALSLRCESPILVDDQLEGSCRRGSTNSASFVGEIVRATEGLAVDADPQRKASGAATPRGERFVSRGDGTVIDTRTGLQWAAQDNGSDIDWTGAKRYAEDLTLGGYSDWRLPTPDELDGLYEAGKEAGRRYGPACRGSGDNGTVASPPGIQFSCWWYWAAETHAWEAVGVGVGYGGRFFGRQGYSDHGTRALPVRVHN